MPIPKEFIADLPINPAYRRPFVDWVKPWPRHKRVDILVVVDTNISTDPVDDFGISRVIELIRGAAVGCMRFNVDIALRNGDPQSVTASPGAYDPKYRGFRFDMQAAGVPVIDKYEQVWCTLYLQQSGETLLEGALRFYAGPRPPLPAEPLTAMPVSFGGNPERSMKTFSIVTPLRFLMVIAGSSPGDLNVMFLPLVSESRCTSPGMDSSNTRDSSNGGPGLTLITKRSGLPLAAASWSARPSTAACKARPTDWNSLPAPTCRVTS